MDGREDRRLRDLLVRRTGAAVADVLAHGVSKEEHVLLYDADVPVERGLRHLPHVLPVYENRAAGHVVKPRQELR